MGVVEMISVIIPTYNCEEYIDRCLDSVLQQTYSDIEVIIVDDCSTDSTFEKCLHYLYSDDRVRLYHNRTNWGVSWTRNFGITKTGGEYICFIDADDELYSKDALQQLYHPEYDLVCGNFELMRDNQISYDKFQLCTETVSLDRAAFLDKTYEYIACPRGTNNLYSDVWAKLHRASIIRANNIQFSQRMTKDEVVAFSIEYATYVSNCLLVPDIVYRYFSTEEMAYHGKYEHGKGNMVFNMVSTFRKAEKFLDETCVSNESKNELLLKFMNYYLNRYLYYNSLSV
jgi:glycosyltransferase involved in cell wall biosynthesis